MHTKLWVFNFMAITHRQIESSAINSIYAEVSLALHVICVGIWLCDGAGESKALGNCGPWAILHSFARYRILQRALDVSSTQNN